MASTGAEALHAEAELWCHTFGYLKSIALQCAIKLGIPNAIHRCGGGASLSELHAALPVAASKRQCISRIMTFLAASGLFREETPDEPDAGSEIAGVRYGLTAASRLLVDVDDGNTSDRACLSRFVLLCISPLHFRASQSLAEWLEDEEEEDAVAAETPFMMVHRASLYDFASYDAEFGKSFNEGLASDSRFVAEVLVRDCGSVFMGVTSLVDVGGGDGTTARAIARAFPEMRCSVLELPHVVDVVPADSDVEFVAGDMMEFIPPANAVLLKFVLHNWSDEDCVQILKRAKEAISAREPKGKVIIIDVVLGSSPSKHTLEAQLLMDLLTMVILPGKQREKKWHRIFQDAGFTQYKIIPVLGSRSIIEVYP